MNGTSASFPTWDGMRELEARLAALTQDRTILIREIGKLRVRLASVETLCDEADRSNDEFDGFPDAFVDTREIRNALRGDEGFTREVDTQLHHDFEPPPSSTGPDGCRRCGQPEMSAVHR